MDDYSEFKETLTPTADAFKELHAKVNEALALEEKIAACEKQQKDMQTELNELQWITIPKICEAMGLAEFKTLDGQSIKITDEIQASISKDREFAAFKWLEENEYGGLIKRVVSIAFNRDQQPEADKLMEELDGRFASLEEKKTVHPQTLKAWVKEMLAKGVDVPPETFGVRKFKNTKLPKTNLIMYP